MAIPFSRVDQSEVAGRLALLLNGADLISHLNNTTTQLRIAWIRKPDGCTHCEVARVK